MNQLTDKEATLYDVLSEDVWYHGMVSDMFPSLFKKGYVVRQKREDTVFYRKVKSELKNILHDHYSLSNHPWLRPGPVMFIGKIPKGWSPL